MTVTTVRHTTWHGAYSDSWQDLIVPEAFAHPAKFARGLIHRIYRHLIEQGYVRQGDVVLDPFGGVALGALDAMTYGLSWVGVELEPRFVTLAQQNLELWRQRYGFTGGTLVQGDSRQLRAVLAGAAVGCVVGSPPYAESLNGESNGIDWSKAQEGGKVATPARRANGGQYGHSAGQLGAMPPGCAVSSPPYAEGCIQQGHDYHPERMVGTRTGYLQSDVDGYGTTPAPDTFWAASSQIMAELAALLPPGAVCAWVLKAYVSKKKIVPFPQQWQAVCEQHGFELVEEIHASLVEHHGTQEGLFDGPQQVTTEKKSFFRRLAEKKGSPRIDYETVLILRKAGDVGGMCVVSSPPFCDNLPTGKLSEAMVADLLVKGHGPARGSTHSATYGTTPGNLGNMPVGMCVVSSPPFGQTEGAVGAQKFRDHAAFAKEKARLYATGAMHGHTASAEAIQRSMERDASQAYGTTPGNLGTMPVETR